MFSTEYKSHEEAIDSIQALPVLQKLDAELEKAVNALANTKASGNDATPLKLSNKVKPALPPHLHELVQLCWWEPQGLRDAKIATPLKNEGDRSDCNNYRGISVLSIVVSVVFSVRQLQERCREQSQPLYMTFVELTKGV